MSNCIFQHITITVTETIQEKYNISQVMLYGDMSVDAYKLH